MPPHLLQTGPLVPALEAALESAYTVTRLFELQDPLGHLAACGGRYTAIASSAAVGFSADLVPRLPGLQVVSNYGVGLDKLPMPALQARQVVVATTQGVLDDCVADAAWALMLAVARQVVAGDAYVRRGDWAAEGTNRFPLGRRVSGARLGLVGLGRIGQVIARRASGFEMPVRYHSRRPVAGVPWVHEPDLVQLARDSDFLVVITTGGPDTRHLIHAGVLDALGPRGFLINVARGSVVDEAALLKALHEGRIAGAGLDVFENEPKINPAWADAPRCVCLPHIASATEETRQAMAELVVANLKAFFDTGRVLIPV